MQAAAKSTLSGLVEEYMTALIREASSVQRHTKRARFQSGDDKLRKQLDLDDINLALQWRGSEKLYATGPTDVVDLNAYLRSEMKARAPSEIGMSCHWLAVDGEQPNIPQNPVPGRVVHRIEDDADEQNGSVRVRQLLPILLSEDLQLYFTRITLAVERGEMEPAVASVSRDSGIQELVPFFVQFVSQQIHHHIGNPEVCRSLVRLAHALLSNPHLHLELNLHQILPSLITCVVAKRLSSAPMSDHWTLREEAARTLVQACSTYGEQYETLKARVIRTMCEAIGPDRPLTTQFGGIASLSLFGPKTIDAFLVPIASKYWQEWSSSLEKEEDPEKRMELQQCQRALLNAMALYMRDTAPSEQCKRLDWGELMEVFGEAIIPMQTTSVDYTLSIM